MRTVTTYVAFDGTEFDDFGQAQQYEDREIWRAAWGELSADVRRGLTYEEYERMNEALTTAVGILWETTHKA